LFLEADQAVLDGSPNGQFTAPSNIRLTASDAQIRNTTFQAGSVGTNSSGASVTYAGALILSVTNRLTDGGAGASNDWQCLDGIQLLCKPAQGDLLGPRVTSKSTLFASVVHLWAAEDRGPSAAGYSNNAALGRLVLDGASDSVFVFQGTGTNNALYVDYLEFRNAATNYTSSVVIDPGFNLYFANASLPPEKLNGTLQGRLRWVSSFAGPASSTNWVSPATGIVYPVNLVLRLSDNIDSDEDGVVNRDDPTPFYFGENVGLKVGVSAAPAPAPVLTWNVLANATNFVEFKTNLLDPGWMVWTNFVRPTNGPVTLTVPVTGAPQSFYRVRVQTPGP